MIACLLLALALASPARAQAEADPAPTATPATASYVVGARDVLHIEVFEEEGLTGDYVVAEDGTIDFPLVGRLPVDGLSPGAVDELLTARLASDFLVSPQVKVQVGSFASKPVRVLGAVKKPGVYPLSGPTSVLELIALAGGMAADGVSEVRITRRGLPDPLVIRLDEAGSDESAWMLQDGDTVQVPPPKVVYVAGEVLKPGSVSYGEGLTISQAIILAGGAKPTASLRKVWIKRGPEQIRVNLKRVLQGKDQDIFLKPDDQVLLSESVL
jgi:polysaccharide export outer membrane protein